ncbi:MAG: MarR family transcriptional regulator [Candidatus Izemoplasmatales bacterium]
MEKRYDYMISKYQHRFLEDKFKNISIARSEAPFLKIIYKNGSIKMNDLISKLFFHKSHATRSINNLVKGGYVTKEKDPEDLRSYILTITEKGEAVAKKIIKALNEWENLMDSFLEDEEKNFLKNLEKKIYEKLKAVFNEDDKND